MKKIDNTLIYKVVTAKDWTTAKTQGEFVGVDIDIADGFIHFSSPSQVRQTVALHFADQVDLRLIGVDSKMLGDDLRWECSRGGEVFPHLYGTFSVDSVVSIDELPIGRNGQRIFPSSLDEA